LRERAVRAFGVAECLIFMLVYFSVWESSSSVFQDIVVTVAALVAVLLILDPFANTRNRPLPRMQSPRRA
jgi:hypothetical protein